MPDLRLTRELALRQAVELHRNDFDAGDGPFVIETANALFGWLTDPIALRITLGPEVDQTTGKPVENPAGGNVMKDTSKSQIIITGLDAKDQPTNIGTDITFTSADPNIASIVVDPDNSVWVVAGLPGSTVVTGDWPDSPSGDMQGTVAVDVTAGDATSLQISLGAEVPQ